MKYTTGIGLLPQSVPLTHSIAVGESLQSATQKLSFPVQGPEFTQLNMRTQGAMSETNTVRRGTNK